MTFAPTTPPPTPKEWCLTPTFETFAMVMAVLCGIIAGLILRHFGIPWPFLEFFVSIFAVFGWILAWEVVAK